MRRRAGLVAGVLLGVLVLFACTSGAGSRGEPAAPFSLTPHKLDLGTCFVGESRRVDLSLRNHGTTSLAIDTIEVPCGCQDVELDGERLPRDNAGVMSATLSPGEHRLVMIVVPPRAGERHLWLRVLGRGHAEFAKFSLRAEEELSVTPAYVAIEGAKVGESREFEAVVTARDGQPFTLTPAQVADGLHDVQVEAAGAGRVVVRGRATPGKRGAVTADVRLRTDRKFADWVYVVVQWDIPEPCAVEPAALVFGVVRAREGSAPRELLVTTPASAPAPVCAIDVTPAGAIEQIGEPRAEVLGERRLTRFYFAPPRQAPPGGLRGRVLVQAGDLAIDVPVSGLIAGGR